VTNIPENKEFRLPLIDPELERIYREHAIAVAITTQVLQQPGNVKVEGEPNQFPELLGECSSTFAKLE
jgi:hypothetical protein